MRSSRPPCGDYSMAILRFPTSNPSQHAQCCRPGALLIGNLLSLSLDLSRTRPLSAPLSNQLFSIYSFWLPVLLVLVKAGFLPAVSTELLVGCVPCVSMSLKGVLPVPGCLAERGSKHPRSRRLKRICFAVTDCSMWQVSIALA